MYLHGPAGGYLYSLCSKSEALTEKCLQANPLTFATKTHTIVYLDGRPSVQIPATDVSEGTFPVGSAWRRDPIPACNCDGGDGCGPVGSSNTGGRAAYADNGKPVPYAEKNPCPYGTMFDIPFPYGYGQHIWDRYGPKINMSEPESSAWVITDQVNVPQEEGDYVLRWRWDAEQNPQVSVSLLKLLVAPINILNAMLPRYGPTAPTSPSARPPPLRRPQCLRLPILTTASTTSACLVLAAPGRPSARPSAATEYHLRATSGVAAVPARRARRGRVRWGAWVVGCGWTLSSPSSLRLQRGSRRRKSQRNPEPWALGLPCLLWLSRQLS